MPSKTPWREPEGYATPKRMYEFGKKIEEKLTREEREKNLLHERSGKISGGKLGQPTLWAVLDMLGVGREWSSYLLGKFRRGNDVERRAIDFLTSIDTDNAPESEWISAPEGSILRGEFMLQRKGGYRGGTGYIDLSQRMNEKSEVIYHEIKSSTKMAYDKVAASGRYKNVTDIEKGIGVPYYHHAIQLAYYALGDDISQTFLHYFNADDYRLTSFAINPLDYKDEIDKEIDDIHSVFLTKQLPSFETFLDYHKAYKKDTYGDWNDLTPSQMMDKLQREFPTAYKKLMETTL